MQTVGQGEGGGSGIRRKYRVLKLKQEWTTSVLVGGGELQRCTFKAVVDEHYVFRIAYQVRARCPLIRFALPRRPG